MLELLRQLSLIDGIALAGFIAAWWGYAAFARSRAASSGSLLATTNRIRRLWMMQTTWRENRVIDGVVVQNLSTSPSFFASTTILIIGGLLALLGATDEAAKLVREIPFAVRTTSFVFDLKLFVLTAIFVYAFFRFTWSMRQYTFGALLIASAPEPAVFASGQASREEFADRAGRVVGMICAAAAISPIVSFLTRRPIVSAAICTGVSSPLISRRHNDSISSWKISRCSMHLTSASLGVIDMAAPRAECRNRSKHLPLPVQVSAPDCGLRHVGHEWIGSIHRSYAPGACRKFFSMA